MKNWRDKVSKEIKKEMIQDKLNSYFKNPSFLEVLAIKCLVTSKLSKCLFYEVGAIIFRNKKELADGYNGPVSGDVHCTDVGCARIVDGEIKEGSGKCRGSHAEINAICNAAYNGVSINGASIIIAHMPCFPCAKQIVNAHLKEVFYIFDYKRKNETNVSDFLRGLGVNVVQIKSNFVDDWIKRNNA